MQLAANTQVNKKNKKKKARVETAKDRLEKTAFPIYESIGK